MNVKEQLEAEADRIVTSCRDGDINAIAAKVATERGYGDRKVRTLAMFINRHHFKTAMAGGKGNEITIADADRILQKMRTTTPEEVKSASYRPGKAPPPQLTRSGDSLQVDLDQRPSLLKKLGARQLELDTQIRVASAELREGLFGVMCRVESVKRAGLDRTDHYQQLMAGIPDSARSMIETAMELSPITKLAFTAGQLRLHLPRALADTDRLIALTGEISAHMAKLADLQERRVRVENYIRYYRNHKE